MPPAKLKPEQLLDLLIEKGPALREAGYLEIDLGVVSATLAPVEAPMQDWVPAPGQVNEESLGKHMDALDDPDTFGSDGTTHGLYEGRRQGPLSNDGARPLDA